MAPLVYILAGQSNMVGRAPIGGITPVKAYLPGYLEFWDNGTRKYSFDGGVEFGPEVGFLHSAADANPGRRIICIKRSQGGTCCYAAWQKVWDPVKAAVTGSAIHMYPLLAADLGNILYGRDYPTTAMIWMQGEQDAVSTVSGDAYADSLDSMLTDMVADFGAIPLFVLGRVWDVGLGAAAVRTHQWAAPAASPGGVTTLAVNTDDLTDIGDGVHYDAASQETLGARFAATL